MGGGHAPAIAPPGGVRAPPGKIIALHFVIPTYPFTRLASKCANPGKAGPEKAVGWDRTGGTRGLALTVLATNHLWDGGCRHVPHVFGVGKAFATASAIGNSLDKLSEQHFPGVYQGVEGVH